METKKTVGFASSLGFILAAAGSAVGLGNIWAFPYKTSQNGGAAFVLLYVACVIFIGFVTMLSEIYLGRRAAANPITSYKKVSKNLGWCGLVAILIPTFITCYYAVLGGWTTKFAVNSFAGNAGILASFSVNTGEVILYTAIFVAIAAIIIACGVEEGIERMSKVLMPILFLIVVGVAIYSLTLGEGVREGLAFYLKPDFSVITFKSVLAAMSQAFFSLSLGMGIMITYGSYLDKKQNIEKNALVIVICDTLIALMAGLAVMPARFALDPEGPIGGPKLLFITMQNVFNSMGTVGYVFGIIFYLLVILAAVSSSISLLEVIVAHFVDKARDKGKGDKRKAYSVIAALATGVLCVLVCLDGLGSNGIAPFNLFGVESSAWSDCWLDFFDMISEGILMPLGALLMCICIGYELKPQFVDDECCLEGNAFKSKIFFNICVKTITPILMVFILLGQIDQFFSLGWFS